MARATDWNRMRSSPDDLLRRPHENAARAILHDAIRARRDQAQNLVLQLLPVAGVIFVPDHQVHRQPFQAPVCLRLDELADQFDVGRVGDLQQHDRQIAGDGVAPQAGLAAAVLRQHAGSARSAGLA